MRASLLHHAVPSTPESRGLGLGDLRSARLPWAQQLAAVECFVKARHPLPPPASATHAPQVTFHAIHNIFLLCCRPHCA